MAEKTVTIKLAGDASNLNAALQQSLRSVQDFGGTLEKVGRSQGIAFSSAIQQDVKQLEILRDHLVKINAPAADLEKVTKRLTEAQLKFKDSLKTDAMKQQEAALESLRGKYVAHEVSLAALGKTVTDNRAGFQALGGVMTAMGGAIVGSLGLSAKAAIDFESAFAGVRKTVNASEPELATMREQFLKMSTEIPVSAGELAKLGQVAGQLGVRKENVVGFARVIADMGIASNLAGEEGATMLAQFGNIVKLDQTKYSNLASALVDLGNNSATTEKDIAAMGLRLAGAGNAAGLSAPQILGLSASLASVGIEAEAGGTAFSQLLIKMQKATKEGGASLKAFNDVTKLVGVDFKKTFEQDASKALTAFLKGVDQLNKSGANTFKILEDMGVEGIRMTDAITRAANANDKFESSIQRSTKAFNENTALAKEAGERYKTVASQLQILANTVTNLAIRIGEAVLPALRAFVDTAKPIISTISDWAKAQPGLTTGIVAFGGAIGGLMLTLGPLLFALPSMVEGFVLAKGAILAMGGVGGVATGVISGLTTAIAVGATAFAAWEIGKWIADITGLDEAFLDLGQSLIRLSEANQVAYTSVNALTFGFLAGDNSAKLLQATTEKLNKTLDTPLIKQASESWDAYSDRVRKAAFEQSGIAEQLKQINTEALKLGSSLGVTLSGALKETAQQHSVLVAQLKEQKAPQADIERATLAANAAWDKYKSSLKDVNIELPKSGRALNDVGKATSNTGKAVRDAGKDFLSLASAAGAVIPKLIEQVKKNEEYVASLKKSKVEGKQLEEAERNLASAKKALTDATKDETTRFLEWRDSVQKGREQLDRVIQSIQTYKGLNFGAGIGADISKIDTGVASLEKMGVALKPIGTAFGDAEVAMKTLGITSSAVLNVQVRETKAAYDSIIAKYGEASREGQLAWAAMSQAQIDATRHAGGEINSETQRAVDAIKSKYGDLKNDKDANLSSWRELASKQVSTLVSDVSKGFADILLSGASFGSKIISMFKNIGAGMLQGFFESGIGGLLSGKGLSGFGGFAGGLLDAIKGGKGGGLTSLAGLGGLGTLFAGGGAAGLSAAGGLTLGSTALSAGVAGALPTTFVNTGIMAGGTAAGTGGGLAATLGAFATNPITIAAAAAIAGVLLTRRLTRRGREKEDATTQAEDMSGDVWQGIVPEVQAGRATIDEGIAAIQQRFADYEAWLRANLKDQTVITRSIESQRITVTESIAVLEQLRGKEAETSALRAGLEKAIEDFAKTGAISQEFSDLIVKLGGNLEEFKLNIADTSQLEKLQAGFSGLRDELVAMIPPAEDMFAAFLRTGEVSEDLRKALDETGLSARAQTAALLKMAEFTKATDNLEDFTFGIGSLREELGRLAIPVRSAYESFVELNEITPELRDEINRFGLDIEAFESFSAIKSLRDDFLSLSQSILATGEGAAALKPIFESVGADTSILGAADQIKSLRAQQTELQAFMADLAKIAPPATGEKSNLQRFIETGMILPDWALELQNKGVDTTKFGAFTEAKGQKETMDALVDEFAKTKVASQAMQDMAAKFNTVIAGSGEQMAAQLKTIQAATDANYKSAAAALGIEIGKLAESVETEIGKLRTALETALTDVGTKLDKQFEDSRVALIGQLNTLETSLHDAVTVATNGLIGALGKIDTHLTNAVNGLKTDLNTAINNLTAAINGVNIPGGSTTSTPPEYPTTPEPTTHTGDRSSRGGFDDYDYGSARSMAEGAESISALAPSLQLQQQYGKSPELQGISEMAIMPAVLERIQVSVARLESGRGGSYAPPAQSSTSPAAVAAQPIQLTQNNTYTLELEDAYRIRQQQERTNQNFVDMLARGG